MTALVAPPDAERDAAVKVENGASGAWIAHLYALATGYKPERPKK